MSRLTTLLTILALLATASAAYPADRDGDEPLEAGALAVRVQNPLFLVFLRLGAATTEAPQRGRGEIAWRSDYSSFFRVDDREPADLVLLDGELWRNTLFARVGVGGGVALWTEIPLLHGGSGFLDHFVEEYHDTFGFDQEGRDENPDDQFAFLLVHEGRLAYSLLEDRAKLGDVALGLDWLVREDSIGAPAIVLRAAVELPSGDEEGGFGSGAIDAGLGVTLRESWTRYGLTGHVGYQVQQTPDAFEHASVRARDNWVADLALERSFGSDLAVVLQWGYEQSPVVGAALAASNDSSGTLTLGLAWRAATQWRLDIAFLEDLDGETTQDFTAHVALRRSF